MYSIYKFLLALIFITLSLLSHSQDFCVRGRFYPFIYKKIIQQEKHVWAATLSGGLYKYNTSTLELDYQYHILNSALTSNDIVDITIDKKGKLWILAGDGTIYKMVKSSLKKQNITSPKLSLKSKVYPKASQIIFDNKNVLWLNTEDKGVVKYANKQFVDFQKGEIQSTQAGAILDSEHTFWAVDHRGLLKITEDTSIVASTLLPETWRKLEKIVEDKNGNIWALEAQRSAYKMNLYFHENDSLVKVNVPTENNCDEYYSNLTVDHEGNVYLVESNNLYKYDGKVWSLVLKRISTLNKSSSVTSGLARGNSLFVDKDKRIWMFLKERSPKVWDGKAWLQTKGLHPSGVISHENIVYDNNNVLYFKNREGSFSCNGNDCNSLLEDSGDFNIEKFVFLSNGKKLLINHIPYQGKFKVFELTDDKTPKIILDKDVPRGERYKSFTTIRDSVFFIGKKDISVYLPNINRLSAYRVGFRNRETEGTKLMFKEDGNIWEKNVYGFNNYNFDKWEFKHTPLSRYRPRKLKTFAIHPDGNVWTSDHTSIYRNTGASEWEYVTSVPSKKTKICNELFVFAFKDSTTLFFARVNDVHHYDIKNDVWQELYFGGGKELLSKETFTSFEYNKEQNTLLAYYRYGVLEYDFDCKKQTENSYLTQFDSEIKSPPLVSVQRDKTESQYYNFYISGLRAGKFTILIYNEEGKLIKREKHKTKGDVFNAKIRIEQVKGLYHVNVQQGDSIGTTWFKRTS